MYAKGEIKEIYNLYLDYLNEGKKVEADHFFRLYLKYSAFTMVYFDLPISNN